MIGVSPNFQSDDRDDRDDRAGIELDKIFMGNSDQYWVTMVSINIINIHKWG